MDEPIITIVLIVLGISWLVMFAMANMIPTELPNDCILYEDAIYCPQEVTE